uniref:NADPH-dependent aldehyde reductase-like protein, chloroplastic n=1 Tax=Erigeron canadensis TaxID=72917 RepID=UPI001CB9661C|nr:NADPH-dependent aldehyde reductase-like protein, chloroplastic [Erigeron canadensis]
MASEVSSVSSFHTAQPQQPLQLQDRVAIVTGGSRGIGKAISLHLASLGAKLVINYNSNSTQADLVVSEINSMSLCQGKQPGQQRAIAVKADVSDPMQVKGLFDAAESAFDSPLHVLVNAAGVMDASYNSLPNSSLDEFDRIFAVNTRGAYLCCKEAANRLKQGGGGRIICLTTSLVASLRPGYGAYTASKAAVEAMVKILAKELKGTKITANCVAPGPIATDMFFEGKTDAMVKMSVDQIPLGRLGQPEDVAPLVGFLASDAGEWVNGQIVRVNGGMV